jgi:hypothetical protein
MERESSELLQSVIQLTTPPDRMISAVGNTIIHVFAADVRFGEADQWPIVEEFLCSFKDIVKEVSRPNALGFTPLMVAVAAKNARLVDMFLKFGAQRHAFNFMGLTAFDIGFRQTEALRPEHLTDVPFRYHMCANTGCFRINQHGFINSGNMTEGDIPGFERDSKGNLPKYRPLISICNRCFQVGYCSKSCQRQHWVSHKPFCTNHKTTFTAFPLRPKLLKVYVRDRLDGAIVVWDKT